MAGLFGPLEAWWPIGSSAGKRSVTSAVVLYFLCLFAMHVVGVPVLGAVASAVPHVELPAPVRWTLVVLGAEVMGYLVHRAMHRVPWLWRFHAVHHAPERMSWLEAWRQHPLDFVAHGIAVGIPGALLGASLSELASVVVLRKAFTTFLHADLRLRLGWLEQVIASPAFHRLHHSARPEEFDSNFAGTFPVLDRLFGTYRAPTGFAPRLGIPGAAPGLAAELLARVHAAAEVPPEDAQVVCDAGAR